MMDHREFNPLSSNHVTSRTVIETGTSGASITNAVQNACGVRIRDCRISPDSLLLELSERA
jgi:CO/xanthine dehydrogenase Mo-binding subunit